MIPSPEDILNLFPIPQEPFFLPVALRRFSKKIKFISNPSSLEFDGDINFQLFNSNIIDDLRTQSLFKIPISQNRIDPCLSNLINQRNLAPLYPTSQPMDLRKYQQLRLDEKPNFLIIPSQIGNGFAKVIYFTNFYDLFFFFVFNFQLVGDTVFINPGYVCKNESSRSYAQIVIYEDQSIKVENRTRVDIIRL